MPNQTFLRGSFYLSIGTNDMDPTSRLRGLYVQESAYDDELSSRIESGPGLGHIVQQSPDQLNSDGSLSERHNQRHESAGALVNEKKTNAVRRVAGFVGITRHAIPEKRREKTV